MLELNLVAAHAGARAAAARMTRGSAIVNVASGADMRAAPDTGAYGASKAALLSLTQTMAAEFAGQGIRINAVWHGFPPTPSSKSSSSPRPTLSGSRRPSPMGRMGTPEDMAAAVLYLASPAASWVTGQNLLKGGGRDGGRSVEHRAAARGPGSHTSLRSRADTR